MTLIITYGNCDFVTQLSDRRLTADGKLIEDESNKAAALFCANGRLAFGFTGLAKTFEFETRKWLLQALSESAPLIILPKKFWIGFAKELQEISILYPHLLRRQGRISD